MNLTTKERELLAAIIASEYQDGGDPVDHAIWLDYIVDSCSRGGVLTSLQRKDYVGVNIAPISKSDNAQAGISDSTVWITGAGYEAYCAEL